MDWFATTSLGAYPTPTPTAAERAIFAVSFGLLDTAPALVISPGGSSLMDMSLLL